VSRWWSALRLEATTQTRQRFVHAAVISGLLWLALLLPMPRHVRPIIEPYVLVGDISMIGFFFIGGSVFFEKQERTLGAIICSPLRFWEYLSVKITLLLAISLFVAVVVVGVTHGVGVHLLPVAAGVALGTLVMLLAGFASSLPFSSVSDWFLSTTVPLAVLALPVLHLSGVWPSPVLYLIPTQGPLLLFGAAFDQVALAPWQVVYALAYPLVCAAGLYRLAKTLFGRYVIERSGLL
jgi:fluoroquinolone transport system permease protein